MGLRSEPIATATRSNAGAAQKPWNLCGDGISRNHSPSLSHSSTRPSRQPTQDPVDGLDSPDELSASVAKLRPRGRPSRLAPHNVLYDAWSSCADCWLGGPQVPDIKDVMIDSQPAGTGLQKPA